MINLIVCIALTSLLFIIFKIYHVKEVNTFEAVVLNYVTCAICGYFFTSSESFTRVLSDLSWLPYSIGLGMGFMLTFFLMGVSVQQNGISVTAIASKMSMVVPIVYALFYLDKLHTLTYINIIGLIVALGSVVLTSYPQRSSKAIHLKYLILIPIIFLLTGMIDTTINVVNTKFFIEDFNKVFPTVSFAIAATIGSTILLVKRQLPSMKSVIGGVALGVPNYFSIYFLLRALEDFNGNGAIVFPVAHISGIIIAAMAGLFVFKDHLSKVNLFGIVTSILAIVLLASAL